MRFHMNPQFAVANAEINRASAVFKHEQVMINHPKEPADTESIQLCRGVLDTAIEELVDVPAYNCREVLVKLELMFAHVDEWTNQGSAIERDLMAAARPQPSPAMANAFAAFRAAWLEQAEHDDADHHDNAEGLRLNNRVADGARSLFCVPCATPGDFVVKAYVNLLWHAGHTHAQPSLMNETGSYFDVNQHGIDSESLLTDAYYRAVYDDLDHSDLGACLLATGNIDFDPETWLDRAETIGMHVSLVIQSCMHPQLAFGMIDSDDERLQREERRLQQILAFDHRSRWKAVAEFVSKHRPDLVAHKVHDLGGAAA